MALRQLTSDGKKYEAVADGRVPAVGREPPIQIAPDFRTVGACKGVITLLDFGQFYQAAWMIEQMLWSDRVQSGWQTRLDALTGTEIQWLPGRENELGRRAARDIEEDWPQIMSAAAMAQLHLWGELLGVGFGQKHWHVGASGRALPRLEVFHPQWGLWDWALRDRRGAYRVWTLDGWQIMGSPAEMVPGDVVEASDVGSVADPMLWVVHEPYGAKSWRRGMVHSLWRPWLGYEMATADEGRACEKQGRGNLLLKYPRSSDGNTSGQNPQDPNSPLGRLMGYLSNLGSESVIPVEQYAPEAGVPSYDVESFDWGKVGWDVLSGALVDFGNRLTISILGHATMAQTQGASVGASAATGNLIRGDIRVGDCRKIAETVRSQILRDWAAVNYGDPSVAPIPRPVTEEPMANVAAADTLVKVAGALAQFRAQAPGVDVTALLNRFQIPMLPDGAGEPVAVGEEGAPGSSAEAATEGGAMVDLTPTDIATIVTVDEGRQSIGLAPEGGKTGSKWIAQHSAEIRAEAAPDIAKASAAESGAPPSSEVPA